jgi:hypothetical protein
VDGLKLEEHTPREEKADVFSFLPPSIASNKTNFLTRFPCLFGHFYEDKSCACFTSSDQDDDDSSVHTTFKQQCLASFTRRFSFFVSVFQ